MSSRPCLSTAQTVARQGGETRPLRATCLRGGAQAAGPSWERVWKAWAWAPGPPRAPEGAAFFSVTLCSALRTCATDGAEVRQETLLPRPPGPAARDPDSPRRCRRRRPGRCTAPGDRAGITAEPQPPRPALPGVAAPPSGRRTQQRCSPALPRGGPPTSLPAGPPPSPSGQGRADGPFRDGEFILPV